MSLEPSAEAPTPSGVHVADPATSPAYVLVGADGGVVGASEVFNRLLGVDVIGAVGAAVAAITSGHQELLGLQIEARHGQRLGTRVEAVLSRDEQRLALIEIQVPRPADGRDAAVDWFRTFAEGSVAIVWLKDLDGRYAYINRRYTAELGAGSEAVVGRTDAELSLLEAIDGPRSKGSLRSGLTSRPPAAEPLSLEYTIPSFDRRPAYAALRFPLLDRSGDPLVVCGVASPADHGEIAQAECAHLLEAARWYRGDAQELRRAAMEQWGIRAVRPPGSLEVALATGEETASATELAGTARRADAAELARTELEQRIRDLQRQVAVEHGRAADLEGSLSDARGRADALAASLEVATTRAGTLDAAHARIRELESMVATASSAGVAAAQSAGRVIALELELRTMRSALAQRDAELAAARADLETQRQAQARHASELRAAQDRIGMELNGANQRHQVEIGHLRAQHAALAAEHQELEQREERAQERIRELEGLAAGAGSESRLAELTGQLTEAHAHIDDLEAALHASRDQIARLERASAAATAAAAGPLHPLVPLSRSTLPAPTASALAPSGAVPAVPVVPAVPAVPAVPPAPAVRLGWDPAAQQALVDALRGCLNVRSILSESVRLIGTGGGWDVVVAWLPNEDGGHFSCAATWLRSPVDMARLETSLWQVRQSATASAVGAAALSREIVWINHPGADGDRHLAAVKAEGVNTVVLVPVRHQGQAFAVLELGTTGSAQASPPADAALRSIEVEVSAAQQRLVDSASANQWGRRRR